MHSSILIHFILNVFYQAIVDKMSLPTEQFDENLALYGDNPAAGHNNSRYVSSQIKSTEDLLDNATRNLTTMNPYLSFEMGKIICYLPLFFGRW